MKVAVFGGTGFVGSYIVDELLNSGYDINILVRDGSEKKQLILINAMLLMGI